MKKISAKKYDEEFEKLKNKLRDEHEIEVYPFFGKTKGAMICVGWEAPDFVSADNAIDFANRLLKVSQLAKEFKYNGYIITDNVGIHKKDVPLSYSEFMELAKENYAKGGMFFVECWEEYQFNNWIKSFGGITEADALKMFSDELKDHFPPDDD